MIDLEIKKIADDKAEGVYHRMCVASADPTKALNEEEAKIYKDLKEWGWFEHCPLNNDSKEQITRLYLSMTRYAKLKWQKDHPPKEKLTKWEVVTGQPNLKKKR